MFHDSMRFNDDHDPDHGLRGGFLACCLNAEVIGLSEERLDLLNTACRDHSGGLTTDEPTIGSCWDADRLDLVRLGRAIDNDAMSTAPGRSLELQDRARRLLTAAPDWPEIFALL